MPPPSIKIVSPPDIEAIAASPWPTFTKVISKLPKERRLFIIILHHNPKDINTRKTFRDFRISFKNVRYTRYRVRKNAIINIILGGAINILEKGRREISSGSDVKYQSIPEIIEFIIEISPNNNVAKAIRSIKIISTNTTNAYKGERRFIYKLMLPK